MLHAVFSPVRRRWNRQTGLLKSLVSWCDYGIAIHVHEKILVIVKTFPPCS